MPSLHEPIPLWVPRDDNFFGMVVPMRTGIEWTNQVGGTACLQPSLEGLYVPLPPEWLPEENVLQDFVFEDYSVSAVEAFLNANPSLPKYFQPAGTLDWMSLTLGLAEAWVPVQVKETIPSYYEAKLLGPFVGQRVVLTYHNSD